MSAMQILPIIPSKNKNNEGIHAENLKKLFALCVSDDTLAYFKVQFAEQRGVSPELREKVSKVLEFFEQKIQVHNNVWAGQSEETMPWGDLVADPFVVVSEEEKLKDVLADLPPVTMHFALSDDAQVRRAYEVEDKEIKKYLMDIKNYSEPDAKKIEEILDKQLNAWLAEEHQLVTKEGRLYHSLGNKTKLRKEQVEELEKSIQSREVAEKSFLSYLEEKGIILAIKKQSFPVEEGTAPSQPTVDEQKMMSAS